jgi:tRNA threonylcarbamoyladenosine biosynthesis protein TsaB
MALLLGIESSSEYCTVLLCNNGEVISKVQHTEAFSHAAVLTRMVESCLNKTSLNFKDLEGVFISMGPGSYTSLRVGVSTAKGIAYAQNIPVIAIPSLKILALSALKYNQNKDAIYVGMTDARRMEVYIGFYDFEGNEVGVNRAMKLNEDSFNDYKGQILVFAGSGVPKAKELYQERENWIWTTREMDWDVFARLGYEKFTKGDFADLVNGEPLYLKPPNITVAKTLN